MLNKQVIVVWLLFATRVLCQDTVKRPEFPDVFQTDFQAMFIKEDGIVELDGFLYYDKDHNRAAFQYTYRGETKRSIYKFDTNELISFESNDCGVEEIPDNPQESFFRFTVDKDKKKKIAGPDIILFFDKSEFDSQELYLIPTLVYKANIDIPMYGLKDCEVVHFFSKSIELPTCKSSDDCQPTLMSISVKCKEDGKLVVDHSYNFFRFLRGSLDESIFQPPPGVYCAMKGTKKLPSFNSYFSFSFDRVEKLQQMEQAATVFSTHQEIWYDPDRKIVRIDEYTENGLMASSRVLDDLSKNSYVIIPTVSTCYILPIRSPIDFGKDTNLPTFFFNDSSTADAINVGQRTVNGLIYEVWSTMWNDTRSLERVVEEIYFLEIIPDQTIGSKAKETYLKISHLDIYMYEMNTDKKYDLKMLKHITINNYRTNPKDWSAFDIASCYNHDQKREFYMTVNGTGILHESKAYMEALEHLYNKITALTGVSLLRFSELTGVFDGKDLIGVKGSIIDNGDDTGFPQTEPDMNKTFDLIQDAAAKGELTISFQIENNQVNQLTVISVEDLIKKEPEKQKPAPTNDCYSGATMAAASLVLLVVGTSFGVAGYYVFLKKRRAAKDGMLMRNIEMEKS